MLNFSQYYLTEAQRIHSVFDTIAKQARTPPVFFTSALMKRLEYAIPNVSAFHATDITGAKGLLDKAGQKSTQISVFTSSGKSSEEFYHSLMKGVETSGGVIAELKGTVDVYFTGDAFTARTKGGRRTVLIGDMLFRRSVVDSYLAYGKEVGDYIEKLMVELQQKLIDLYTDVMNKYVLPFIKKVYYEIDHDKLYFYETEKKMKTYREWETAWSAIQFLAVTRDDELGFDSDDISSFIRYYDKNGKIMQKIVKDYMDGMERIISENPEYKKIFLMPYKDTEKFGNISYDEAIMSDFEVQKLHVFPSEKQVAHFESQVMDEFEREEYMDEYTDEYLPGDAPVVFWVSDTYVEDLFNYVQGKAKSFVDIYKKKAQNI